MFDTSDTNLANEIDGAWEFRKRHTNLSAKCIQRYAGRNWRDDWKQNAPVYKPHEFEYVSNFLPQLIYANPQCQAETDLPGFADDAAESIQQGLNGTLPQIRFAETGREVALDTLFDFGVFLVTLEKVPGFEESPSPPLRPSVSRVSPRMFFMDPRATSPKTARYMGHMWIRDKDTLKAEVDENGQPVYIPAALDGLPKEGGLEDIAKDLMQPASGQVKIDRNDIIGIEMWIPETGQVYTLGVAGGQGFTTAKTIRAPRPYFGHPAGPYRLAGIYNVPDQIYPLSPLAVSSDKVAEFNAHADKAARDAGAAKRLLLVNAANKALSSGVTVSADGNVLAVPSFANEFAQVEFGGVQKETAEYLMTLAEDLDRQSGLSDIARGNITGKATATEIAEASAGASIRVRAAQTVFRECVASVMEAMAWLMWNSEHVQFPMGVDDPATGQRVTKLFVGGKTPGVSFESLRIVIEPYSMEMVSQATLQAQATETVGLVMQAVPMIAQFPAFPWDKLFDDFGESRNRKDLGKRYAAPFMQQALLQQQIMALATAQGAEVQQQEGAAA